MTPPARPNRLRRALGRSLLAVAGAAALVAAVVAAGGLARDYLGPQERYFLRFGDIDCDAPPGQDRRDFLDEVQYLGGLPERVNLLDPQLPDRLREAFARHPKVETVAGVSVTARKVRVELDFRKK